MIRIPLEPQDEPETTDEHIYLEDVNYLAGDGLEIGSGELSYPQDTEVFEGWQFIRENWNDEDSPFIYEVVRVITDISDPIPNRYILLVKLIG